MTKVSFHSEYTLVKTDTIDFSKLKEKKSRMYMLVEIHDTESDEVGCIMEEIDGQLVPQKFDTHSQANYHAVLIKEKLRKSQYTHIVWINEDKDSVEE